MVPGGREISDGQPQDETAVQYGMGKQRQTRRVHSAEKLAETLDTAIRAGEERSYAARLSSM